LIFAASPDLKGRSGGSSVRIAGLGGCSTLSVVGLGQLAFVLHVDVAPDYVVACCATQETVIHNGSKSASRKRWDGLILFVTNVPSLSSLLDESRVRSTLLKVQTACECVVVAEAALSLVSAVLVFRVMALRLVPTMVGWKSLVSREPCFFGRCT